MSDARLYLGLAVLLAGLTAAVLLADHLDLLFREASTLD